MIKILIVIFSATGNTAKMAEVIQEELKQLGADIEEKDITSYDDRKVPLDLTPYHAVIFGFPIHARRAPRIVREWLDTLDGQGKLCGQILPGLIDFRHQASSRGNLKGFHRGTRRRIDISFKVELQLGFMSQSDPD